jgi:hypothetical protein
MRLKPIVIWVLILAAAFVVGFFLTNYFLHRADSLVQDQNAPGAPSK